MVRGYSDEQEWETPCFVIAWRKSMHIQNAELEATEAVPLIR